MTTSRETVRRAITFQGIERLPCDLPEPYGSDFAFVGMSPAPDGRPKNGPDEWGAVWRNIGTMSFGEVKEYPLKDWSDFATMKIPDVADPKRWEGTDHARDWAKDKFMLTFGISIYERVHFLRGLENTWMDMYTAREELEKLLDILVEMNLYAIDRYAKADADGFFIPDDWGLQNALMISPELWREIWKPRYARMWKAAHEKGILTFLHSCGYIVEILDDLIDAGLDVIHMDQQENMGLELLGSRFGGRLTFYAPVDIQNTMVSGTPDQIREYCRKMARLLGRPRGGFIPRTYSDPVGAGHSKIALDTMCDEFLKLSAEHRQFWNIT